MNVRKYIPERVPAPAPAKYFGLAGLLPFYAGAVASWYTPNSWFFTHGITVEFALCAYGAVILSFLGGIRWGVAMHHEAMIASWSVVGLAMVPSLLAWSAMLLNPVYGLVMVAAGLLVQYVIDIESVEEGITPAWFASLRMLLTSRAVLCLMIGWFAVQF